MASRCSRESRSAVGGPDSMKSTDSKHATLVRRIRRNRKRGETATNAHKPAHDPNRLGDSDPAGIVFYPRYFEWFGACAAALFEAAGFLRGDLVARQGMVIPMVDTRSRFLIPFRFGDELTVETAITRASAEAVSMFNIGF